MNPLHLLSRRAYLQQTLTIASAMTVPVRAASRSTDILYAGGSFRSSEQASQQFCLASFNHARQERTRIDSPFFPHALCQSPSNPGLCLGFEKIGAGAALFDLKAGKLVKQIAPRAGKLFYGHGAFSPDGRWFYCTESSLESASGSIGVFDAGNLQAIAELPSHGLRPHDLRLSADGKTLLVTNGGGPLGSSDPANLCWIDAKSGQLLRQLKVQHEALNAGHFAVHEQISVVVSAPRTGLAPTQLGGIQVHTASMEGGKLMHLKQPDSLTSQLFGESLSLVLLPQKNRFYVSHPGPGLVSRWNIKSFELEQTIALPKARGLALSSDNSSLYVSYDNQAKLAKINISAGEDSLQASSFSNTLLSGSHLFNWPQ